jgi:deoxyribodipyrimidine photo-lyase
MIVASFLTKDLLIDWRKGEKYFATKLLDYDPCVNNGSWQWAASTGCDAQPYFRIFNPWSQQKRFDEDCEYIKKWIPELKELTKKEILNLEHARPIDQIDYPTPIVTHKEQREKALAMYKKVF